MLNRKIVVTVPSEIVITDTSSCMFSQGFSNPICGKDQIGNRKFVITAAAFSTTQDLKFVLTDL